MTDDIGSGLSGEDTFTDLRMEQLVALIEADHAKVPTWRTQAKGLRDSLKVAVEHHALLSQRIAGLHDAWDGSGTRAYTEEAEAAAGSIQRAIDTATAHADAVERWADEADAAWKDVTETHDEWRALEARYQQDPHLFDGFTADGSSGYQTARASYEQTIRDRVTDYGGTTSAESGMRIHEVDAYDGPAYAKEPTYPLDGGGGAAEGSDAAGGSGSTPPTSPWPPLNPFAPPTEEQSGDPEPGGPRDSDTDGPQVEFPASGTATAPPLTSAPGAGPPAVPPTMPSSPVPAGPGGYPLGTGPGGVPRPGVLGTPRPGVTSPYGPTASGPKAVPPGGRAAPGPKASPSVLGQRPGGTTGSRTPVRNRARPAAPKAERGVIRNPASTSGHSGDDRDRPDYADGGFTDELFEGVDLTAVEPTVKPVDSGRKVRRRDAGPAMGRNRWISGEGGSSGTR